MAVYACWTIVLVAYPTWHEIARSGRDRKSTVLASGSQPLLSVILWDILVAVVAIVLLEWTVRDIRPMPGPHPRGSAPSTPIPRKMPGLSRRPRRRPEAGANLSTPPAATGTSPA